MLKLMRQNLLFDEYDEGYFIHSEWCVGKFDSFKDVNKYLINYHNYGEYNIEEKEKILTTIGRIGHCFLPHFDNEYIEDGKGIKGIIGFYVMEDF